MISAATTQPLLPPAASSSSSSSIDESFFPLHAGVWTFRFVELILFYETWIAINLIQVFDKVWRIAVGATSVAASRPLPSLRGDGDAKAAEIYASAFNQDPEFYGFYRSINAYGEVFKDKSDLLVLDPDSDFFKYLESGGAK